LLRHVDAWMREASAQRGEMLAMGLTAGIEIRCARHGLDAGGTSDHLPQAT
jgi:hypothetical protein